MTETNGTSIGMLALRLGLAFVFLFFGFSQLHDPQSWTGFLPSFVQTLPLTQVQFVLLNGLFEMVAAALLLVGAYTRITALLLALHLFGIAFTIGLNALGVRDIGLAIATLSLAIVGAGVYSVDGAARKPAAVSVQ